MKQTSIRPRALFGFGAIWLLLGLIAFIALPTQSALASPPCTEVVFTNSNGPNGSKRVSMESHTEGDPGSPCTIYFTMSQTGNPPPEPTHSSSVYVNPLTVPWNSTRYFLAFGHKTGAVPEDTIIFDHLVVNGGP